MNHNEECLSYEKTNYYRDELLEIIEKYFGSDQETKIKDWKLQYNQLQIQNAKLKAKNKKED